METVLFVLSTLLLVATVALAQAGDRRQHSDTFQIEVVEGQSFNREAMVVQDRSTVPPYSGTIWADGRLQDDGVLILLGRWLFE